MKSFLEVLTQVLSVSPEHTVFITALAAMLLVGFALYVILEIVRGEKKGKQKS